MELRVLHIIPYESSRKRMSMIVEMPDGSIRLYCKVRDEEYESNDRVLIVSCWSYMIHQQITLVLWNQLLVKLDHGLKKLSVQWYLDTRC